jgi:Fic family protein|tara:strand:- start:1508 stop:1774 length:267 start_codon:yes stop_codon:yes gene_type:complete
MAIIRKLLDKKLIRILDLLLKNKEKYFHLSEISNASKTSLASTFRTINRLVSLGIIDVTVLGKMKIYRIASNDETKELEEVLDLENKK